MSTKDSWRLVKYSIIGLLVCSSLICYNFGLIPSFWSPKSDRSSLRNVSYLKQLHLSIMLYADDHDSTLPVNLDQLETPEYLGPLKIAAHPGSLGFHRWNSSLNSVPGTAALITYMTKRMGYIVDYAGDVHFLAPYSGPTSTEQGKSLLQEVHHAAYGETDSTPIEEQLTTEFIVQSLSSETQATDRASDRSIKLHVDPIRVDSLPPKALVASLAHSSGMISITRGGEFIVHPIDEQNTLLRLRNTE